VWAATIEPPAITPRVVGHLLHALTAIDLDFLRDNPATPALYRAGVRYREEPQGAERWRSIPWVLRAGWGDCEDLCCWRVAELRAAGERAFARSAFKRRAGGWLVHVFVERGNGTLEDPSRLLGMKG
jgi:hypothetical protein